MEIDYRCNRCQKVVRASVYLQVFKGKPSKRDGRHDHNRVDCTECGRFIKFIGERELDNICFDWRSKIKKDRPKMPSKKVRKIPKKKKVYSKVDLSEVNFKLDLILDHLGIVSGGSFVEDYKLRMDR